MRIEYFHASKFGNGASVAQEFKKQMAERGVVVERLRKGTAPCRSSTWGRPTGCRQ